MMNWAKTTAYSLGYVLVTQRSKKYKNGFIWKVHLMCDRSGKYGGLESSIGTSTKKTDCPFQLIGQYSKSHGYWTIRVVCDQHNHLSTHNLEGHAYARRLSDDEYPLVEDLTWKNVRPREILSTLKDQNENNLSTVLTKYDAQHKIRKIEYGGKTPMQVLMSLLHINRYVYEPFINPVTNELQALFFVHPKSYEIWRAFPHVLIIDATEEKMDNYKWALEQLKLTLNECMRPRVIVMDRELALMKTFGIVFPQANHILCRWHIGQNIWKHCRKTIKSNRDWGLTNL
ncbi:FAR1-related sequence 5-like protein [Tanacetum coccineum]